MEKGGGKESFFVFVLFIQQRDKIQRLFPERVGGSGGGLYKKKRKTPGGTDPSKTLELTKGGGKGKHFLHKSSL